MDERIRNAIAKIELIKDGAAVSRGTGCLIAEGMVLTAFHVIGDRQAAKPHPFDIRLTFPNHVTTATLEPSLWDHLADWAILRLAIDPPANPVPMGEVTESHGAFETYGFPDANPGGMVQTGTIEDHLGQLQLGGPSQWVFQLYSRQAAAGDGAPVRGLSGGPVIVSNAIVGVMRFALMDQQRGTTVAGTVYACPVARVLEKTGTLLPLPDPICGLPGLPHHPLPPSPYKYLDRFGEDEAELFFGRSREVRELYDRLTSPDAPPVTLFYGQSGVGKSSVIDAGVVPRLRWHHDVRYIRRSAKLSLIATLLQALPKDPAAPPAIIFFDQIEEIFTQPRPGEVEIEDLSRVLAATLGKHKLVLCFRKEWLPEIQRPLETAGIAPGRVFLERLDRAAIVEIVQGLTRTARLRMQYGLEIEANVPERIADELLEDASSPIAPTLQILLTKLWAEAQKPGDGKPKFTLAQFEKCRADGLGLGDFLDQQMKALWKEDNAFVDTGFAYELLAAHTTPMLTSEQRTQASLVETFDKQAEVVPKRLEQLKQYTLLSTTGEGVTRLIHDTLAPQVRMRTGISLRPAQRGRRVIEGRAEAWKSGDGEPMTSTELQIVQRGMPFFHRLQPHEQRLLDASVAEERARRRNWWLARGGVLAMLVVSVVLAVYFGRLKSEIAFERDVTTLQQDAAQASNWYQSEPTTGLALAVSTVRRNLRLLDGKLVDDVEKALFEGVIAAPETAWWYTLEDGAAMASSVESRVAVLSQKGRLEIFDIAGKRIHSVEAAHEQGGQAIAYSNDGQTIVTAGAENTVRAWDRDGHPALPAIRFRDDILDLAVLPEGNFFAVLTEKELSVWSMTGERKSVLPVRGMHVLTTFLGPDGDGMLLAAGAGVRRWAQERTRPGYLQERPLAKPIPARPDITAIAAVANLADHYVIATANSEFDIQHWDGDGEPIGKPYDGHEQRVFALGISRAGDVIVSGGGDGLHFSNIWGDQTVQPLRTFSSAVLSLHIQVPSRERIFVMSGDTVTLIDWKYRGAQVGTPVDMLEDPPAAIDWSSSTNRIAAGGRGGSIVLLDPDSRRVLKTVSTTPPIEVTALAFANDGKTFLTGHADGAVRIWDSNGKPVGQPLAGHHGAVEHARFSPDGLRLISGDTTGIAFLWNVRTGEKRELQSETGRPIRAARICPLNKHYAISRGDSIVVGLVDGTQARTIETATTITALAFSPDGKEIVTGSADGYLQAWDVASGKAKDKWVRAHTDVIARVDWRGDRVFSAGLDGKIGISSASLDRLTGISLRGHIGSVLSVAAEGGGGRLVSAGADHTIRFWQTNWEHWLETACDRLREHPVIRYPAAYQLQPQVVEEARALCQERVWSRQAVKANVAIAPLPPISLETVIPKPRPDGAAPPPRSGYIESAEPADDKYPAGPGKDKAPAGPGKENPGKEKPGKETTGKEKPATY